MNIKSKSGQKLSVLIVEDESDLRDVIKEYLKMADCFDFIVEARDGQDAYARYQNQEFDLIITDLMMPKASGLELVINIMKKERSKQNKTPLLILSGNLTSLEVKKAIKFGVKYMLAKPCEAEAFIEKVKNIIVKHKRDKVLVKAA